MQLLKELEVIKENGYAFDVEERDEDVSCVAAPIFGPDNDVIACLSISGPNSRFSEANKNKWVDVIVKISDEASSLINSR